VQDSPEYLLHRDEVRRLADEGKMVWQIAQLLRIGRPLIRLILYGKDY
jgi:hypothetical protein